VTSRWSITDAPLRERMATAVADDELRTRVGRAVDRFASHRASGLAELHDADGLRRVARAVRGAVLADLPAIAERFAAAVEASGGHVHWAADAGAAVQHVLDLARRNGARSVVKSKSMVTEEIGLNEALEADGLTVTETDLGEWIIQLAREAPSHIIAPAVHHDRRSIAALFAADGRTEPGDDPERLNAYARAQLRARFLAADIGVSGANLGVASTGSILLVSNEGNARMCTSLPKVHVAVVGIERLVADWGQADLLLTLLTRSATGQRLSSYVSVITGPGRGGDTPEELHVVLLDGGRSDLLGTDLHEALACIRCGACLNVCPVYRQTGGHAYGWVYSGPIGAVLTPSLAHGVGDAEDVARASTLCGACMDACPVEIPLQDLLLVQRRRRSVAAPAPERLVWRAWAAAWSRPAGYGATTTAAGWARFAGERTVAGRVVPTPPPGGRFRDRWARRP
jgi:L-lactate dehydrogenase complex protein LldF